MTTEDFTGNRVPQTLRLPTREIELEASTLRCEEGLTVLKERLDALRWRCQSRNGRAISAMELQRGECRVPFPCSTSAWLP
jgi:hypothetical protein